MLYEVKTSPPSRKPLIMMMSTLWMCVACGSNDSDSSNTGASGNGGTDTPPAVETISDDLFDRSRLIQINIDMPAADFSTLRGEARTLDTALSECPSTDFEYTEFSATVTIDGEVLENVEIRKKGYLGSITRSRPSLKLDFDKFVDDREFKTMTRMTLNNDRQDPSHTHQCMAYDMFRAAGIAAPRCNWARVTVNGEDLGIYSNVEDVKKPFLENHFGDKSGNLYEAQVADFGTHLNDRFELKTNEKANDRTDLDTVANALLLDDQNFIAALPQLIDVDKFISYWAVETLIGHWDSASGNANNYFIYHNPVDGLFHFIPWGTDAAFTGVNIFKPNSGPLYRNHSIASRLYAIDSYRQQYHNRINELLATHWNEESLLAEVERIRLLTGEPESAYTAMRQFISGNAEKSIPSQRQLLTSAINGTEPEQTEYVLTDAPKDCAEPATYTQLSASFQSGEGSDTGTFSFTNIEGVKVIANMMVATWGPDGVDSLVYTPDESTLPGVVGLTLVGVDVAANFKPYVLQLYIENPDYKTGEHTLQGLSTNMMLFEVVSSKPLDLRPLAYGNVGTISLETAGTGTTASPIKGSINAQLGFVRTLTAP
jgi:hypothetical protein